jgi:hypothetical protein
MTTWEECAIQDGLLKKDGTLNKQGIQEMSDLLNSDCKGSYENGYGSFLESRLGDE